MRIGGKVAKTKRPHLAVGSATVARMSRSTWSFASLVFSGAVVAMSASTCTCILGCASDGSAHTDASAPDATDPLGALPQDFAIELAVEVGRGVDVSPRAEERAAVYVLLADGSLHAEAEIAPLKGKRPARVRRLSREQESDLWRLVVDGGFGSASTSDSLGNVWTETPSAGTILVKVRVSANGQRWCFLRQYTPATEDERAVRRLTRALASLAWMSDEPLAETAEFPMRYDLGADPYASLKSPPTIGRQRATIVTPVPAAGGQ